MVSNNNVVYITPEGLKKIKEELDYLINTKRVEISEKLKLAIAEGDLSENANYHDAKEQQSFIEGRIRDLEDSLRRAQVIEETDNPGNKVRVGSTVVIAEVEYEEEEEEYRIVGVHEADPTKGLISNESPIGRALLGAKKGQTITAETPRGEIQFKILQIK